MSKGLSTRTIVLLITGLIVLGIIITLIFIGFGPFKNTSSFTICKTRLMIYCNAGGVDWASTENSCTKEMIGGYNFCKDAGTCLKGSATPCSDTDKQLNPGGTITCCNYMKA